MKQAGCFVAAVIATACGGSDRNPTAPTTLMGPTYTISGVMSTYRGGPAGGVGVTAFEYPPGNGQRTLLATRKGITAFPAHRQGGCGWVLARRGTRGD